MSRPRSSLREAVDGLSGRKVTKQTRQVLAAAVALDAVRARAVSASSTIAHAARVFVAAKSEPLLNPRIDVLLEEAERQATLTLAAADAALQVIKTARKAVK